MLMLMSININLWLICQNRKSPAGWKATILSLYARKFHIENRRELIAICLRFIFGDCHFSSSHTLRLSCNTRAKCINDGIGAYVVDSGHSVGMLHMGKTMSHLHAQAITHICRLQRGVTSIMTKYSLFVLCVV